MVLAESAGEGAMPGDGGSASTGTSGAEASSTNRYVHIRRKTTNNNIIHLIIIATNE